MKRNLLPVSEADTVWLLKNFPEPVMFAFGSGGMAIEVDECPEAAEAIKAYWAEAVI
jgi:hypothetical protein